jgi:hypothetical protein
VNGLVSCLASLASDKMEKIAEKSDQ